MDMERLRQRPKVVGFKQSRKAILKGQAQLAYLAEDADPYFTEEFTRICRENGVLQVSAPSMKALAKACHVEVPTACAVLLCES